MRNFERRSRDSTGFSEGENGFFARLFARRNRPQSIGPDGNPVGIPVRLWQIGADGGPVSQVLYRAQTLIERDALVEALSAEGIESLAQERDQIPQLTNDVNLRLGGYSAMFEGYEIRVPQEQFESGQRVLQDFLRRAQIQPVSEASAVSQADADEAAFRRFMAHSFWAIILPILFNLTSFYWLWRARRVLHRHLVLLVLGLLLNAATLGLVIYVGWTGLKKTFIF